MVYDGTSNSRKLYQNNIEKTVSYLGGGYSGDFSDYTSFVLGNANWGALAGEIHSIRIYNRLLTTEERNQNYQIDKLRFGIL